MIKKLLIVCLSIFALTGCSDAAEHVANKAIDKVTDGAVETVSEKVKEKLNSSSDTKGEIAAGGNNV
ncbi:hypothetical protein [Cytobacillus oceanisediminis]|uniref:Small secreted protein n=1 Tax=Cytobacillus oceanisediminis TaxID=665099 RepID=A0A562J1V4_9BACI|nr:hypothetical protein [Cytobacillus oceanisediminis]TWH77090.1 hypothetical protein IQ19_05638 [Cytobacillus oceanisediminis]